MPSNKLPWRIIQLRDIQNVGAGNTAIINCPKGPRYKKIMLILGNSAAANGNAPAVSTIVTELKLVLGTGIQRHLYGSQIDVLNKAMGTEADYSAQAIVTGGANGTGRTELPIFFEEPWRKNDDFQSGLAWQTGWLGKNDVFQVQVALAGGITPVLSAFAVIDDYYNGKGAHPIMKWFVEQSNSNSNLVAVDGFTQGYPAEDLLSQISLFATSDGQAINQVRMVLNKELVFDDVTNLQNLVTLVHSGMKPDTGNAAYHIVFDHDDMFASLRRVGDISSSSLLMTLAGASNGTISRVTQRLGMPE